MRNETEIAPVPQQDPASETETAPGTKRCSRCGEQKELGAFRKNTASRDGLQSSCKPCRNAVDAARKRKLRTGEIPYIEVHEKVCTQCQECLSVTAFAKDRKCRDGLQCWCKVCQKAAQIERASKRRTGEIPYIEVHEKVCTQCQECLPATAFTKKTASRDGLGTSCKPCNSSAQTERVSKLRTGEIPYIEVHEKVCTQCQECLPVTAFAKTTASRDGLQSSCKPCRNAVDAARKRKLRTGEIPYIEVHEKVCTQCQECLPVTAFVKNTASRDGLHASCKACRNAADAAWKLRDPLGFALANSNRRHQRRARERTNGGTGFTKAHLYLLHEKQGATCPYCATYRQGQRPHRISLTRRASYHIDHVIPLVKGGTHDITNLILCCPECNLKKQATAAPVPVQTLLPLQNLQPRRVS